MSKGILQLRVSASLTVGALLFTPVVASKPLPGAMTQTEFQRAFPQASITLCETWDDLARNDRCLRQIDASWDDPKHAYPPNPTWVASYRQREAGKDEAAEQILASARIHKPEGASAPMTEDAFYKRFPGGQSQLCSTWTDYSHQQACIRAVAGVTSKAHAYPPNPAWVARYNWEQAEGAKQAAAMAKLPAVPGTPTATSLMQDYYRAQEACFQTPGCH